TCESGGCVLARLTSLDCRRARIPSIAVFVSFVGGMRRAPQNGLPVNAARLKVVGPGVCAHGQALPGTPARFVTRYTRHMNLLTGESIMEQLASRRPYLIRALYEWVLDNDCTPHLLVAADAPGVTVPKQFVAEDGRITINVSPGAIRELELG